MAQHVLLVGTQVLHTDTLTADDLAVLKQCHDTVKSIPMGSASTKHSLCPNTDLLYCLLTLS